MKPLKKGLQRFSKIKYFLFNSKISLFFRKTASSIEVFNTIFNCFFFYRKRWFFKINIIINLILN